MDAREAYEKMYSELYLENKYPNRTDEVLNDMYKLDDLFVFEFINKHTKETNTVSNLHYTINSKTGDSEFVDGIELAMKYGINNNLQSINFREFKEKIS